MCHANHMLHVGTSADQIILNPNEMLMQQCNVGRAYVGVDKKSIYGRYGWGWHPQWTKRCVSLHGNTELYSVCPQRSMSGLKSTGRRIEPWGTPLLKVVLSEEWSTRVWQNADAECILALLHPLTGHKLLFFSDSIIRKHRDGNIYQIPDTLWHGRKSAVGHCCCIWPSHPDCDVRQNGYHVNTVNIPSPGCRHLFRICSGRFLSGWMSDLIAGCWVWLLDFLHSGAWFWLLPLHTCLSSFSLRCSARCLSFLLRSV